MRKKSSLQAKSTTSKGYITKALVVTGFLLFVYSFVERDFLLWCDSEAEALRKPALRTRHHFETVDQNHISRSTSGSTSANDIQQHDSATKDQNYASRSISGSMSANGIQQQDSATKDENHASRTTSGSTSANDIQLDNSAITGHGHTSPTTSESASINDVTHKEEYNLIEEPSDFGRFQDSIGWHKWCETTLKPLVSNDDRHFLWADKHKVKELVHEVVPNLRVAKEYAYVDKPRDITTKLLTTLPQTYFMKATHTSGALALIRNKVVKCLRVPCRPQNNGEPNVKYLQRLCQLYLNTNYGMDKGERWYGKIAKRCIFEESFPEAASKDFKDYKVWVMNGHVSFVQIDYSRHVGKHRRNYVTPAWKHIPMKDAGSYSYEWSPTIGPRPLFWSEMLNSAELLAKKVGVAAIRVDFFGFGDSYAFAEISFAHDSCKRGRSGFVPDIAEKFYGYVTTHPDMDFDPELIHVLLNE